MKILFVITGSIAVSRCYEVFKILSDNNIYINCLISESAKKLLNISDLKKSISGKIYTNKSEKNQKMLHINLSRENDLIVVFPATANTIAKYANGYGDNLTSTTLLASDKQIIFIPAMNHYMWKNKINKKNVNYLKSIGIEFIGPKKGKLKCGEYGVGRIEETKIIVNNLLSKLIFKQKLLNKKCLVTAGPTIEKIDPVRYISNFSSGKQGFEIADQLAKTGAKVTLIAGPTNLETPANVKLIKIQTADEMLDQINKTNKKIDIAIFSAAVADFKINKIKSQKTKKNNLNYIKLVKNIDILKTICLLKKNRPKYVVGFAAETSGIINAKRKFEEKNCDMLIYNKICKQNKIFGLEQNKISIITKTKINNYAKTSKINCAKLILNAIYRAISV